MTLLERQEHIQSASHQGPGARDDEPLYSSRLVKTYLEYVEKYYPYLDSSSLLSYAGIAGYEVEDQGHWFTQRHLDRFHQILVERTGDLDISRKAGRYAASSKAIRAVRQYTLGFMSVAAAYWVIKNLASRLTRAHKFETKNLGRNKVEISVSANPGVNDRPYMCENRLGFFESISKVFTNEYAKIEHPVCIHRGGDICRYIIFWARTPSLKWKRIRNYLLLLGVAASLGLFFLMPIGQWEVFVLFCATIIAGTCYYPAHLEKEELVKTIETQADAAEDHLDEMNIRYNNALLVQEIGQATSTILDADKLIKAVMSVMEKRLDFDRGMIMLADKENTQLLYAAGYGYDGEQEKALQETTFQLNNPESKGVFVVAFNEQKPFLLNDITEESKGFSKRSQDLAKRMGVKSLICVPIVYEKRSLGIVTVDNIESKRPLAQSDMSVLMGVASQTGVSIVNASSFQKLRESEEKYRTILEGTEEGYFEVDLSGNLTFFNESLCKISGYPSTELQGMNYRVYATPETSERMYQIFEKIVQTGKPERTIDYEIIRKDGVPIVLGMSASLIRDDAGQPAGFRGVVRDITERTRAEEALRASEERYRTVLEGNPDPVVVYDMAGAVVYLNPAFTRVFGWTLEERLGKVMDVYVPEENRPETERMIGKMLAGESFSGIETQRYTKAGDIIHVSISGSTYRDGDGNPVGSVNALRNVSEQKKLEAQLQRAQKMEAIGTLAGGVAHDLNNILSGLVSYPELLLMEIPEDSRLRKPILTIEKSGQKAAAIVQDLLTLARRGVSITEAVNLNDIIADYLESLEYGKLMVFHPHIRVITRLEEDLLPISGSPVHLSKTVMNLVSNAAEAMADAGRIVIATENRYVDRPIKGYDQVDEGEYVVLSVSDTGVGIAPRNIEKIFEPFYTKKVMGRSGTGLGMAVVWGTVKDHRGYIDVVSAEGEGTTFTLYFPMTRKEIAKDKELLSMEEYRGKGESILVVDDIEEQREIACEMLRKLGYAPNMVSDGAEAVEYMKSNSVDLLVLDMIMGLGIDGFETYKRILKLHPGQKAIIVSGFSETKRVKGAQKLGAGAYVKKPFSLQKIGVAVRNELDK